MLHHETLIFREDSVAKRALSPQAGDIRFSLCYEGRMTTLAEEKNWFRPLAIVAGLAAAAGLVALAFSAWLRYGPEIFLVLSDNGINWCL